METVLVIVIGLGILIASFVIGYLAIATRS